MRFVLTLLLLCSTAIGSTLVYTDKVDEGLYYVTHPDIGVKSTIHKVGDEWAFIPRPDGLKSIPMLMEDSPPYIFYVYETLGVSVPFDMLDLNPNQWINGANNATNSLTDQTTNSYNLAMVQSSALEFDGVGDSIATGVTNAPDGSVYKVVIAGVFPDQELKWLLDNNKFDDGLDLYLTSGAIIGRIEEDTVANDSVTATYAYSNTAVEITWQFDSTTGRLDVLVDGVSQANGTEVGLIGFNPFVSPTQFYLMVRRTGASEAAGVVHYAYMSVDGVKIFDYNFSEGAGAIAYDVTGNGNHGAITSTSGLATMWAARQDNYHYNMINGFTKVAWFNGSDAYADTGIIPTANTKIIIRGRLLDTVGAQRIFGGADSPANGLVFGSGTAWSLEAQGQINTGGTADTDVHTFRIEGDKLYVDDVETVDSSGGGAGYGSTTNVLGAYSLNGTNANHANFDLEYFEHYESGVLQSRWEAANSTSTNLHASTGTDIELVNGVLKYLPALDDGTDDVAGFGLLNPPIASNVMHNGAETLLQQANGNEADLGHSLLFYDTDYTTELQVGYTDFKAWVSGTSDTWLGMSKDANNTCLATGVAIFPSNTTYSATDYGNINDTIPNTCGGGVIPSP